MLEQFRTSRAGTRLGWNRATATAAVVSILALTAAGSAGSVATAAPPGPECDATATHDSAARTTPGAKPRKDPNHVTPARAAAMDRVLKRAVVRLKRKGTLERSTGESARTTAITIRTHVHVITRTDGTGNVPLSRIKTQINILNKAYAGDTSYASAATPFRFVLATVDVTKNNNWHNWNTSQDNDSAKKALRRGGLAHLNIYIAKLAEGLLGYASFPGEGDPVHDGVVLHNQSLPGGSFESFNKGDTATHEVGHWLGLFHTFQHGCVPPGDYVDDTPFQADGENIYFCRATDNTCRQPGRDPVHNFMSYGDDVCMDRFTAGQGKRMSQSWYAFRSGR